MRYLVVEVHPAYAVVLDQEGRFLKVANRRYQVGDQVDKIVEFRPPRQEWRGRRAALLGTAGLAACLCLVLLGYYQFHFTAYGTLRIRINPDVEMTVSRSERVLKLSALNGDGAQLLSGYDCRGKDRETAAGELVERAIQMGYLSDGETVTITVRSQDAEWQAREETQTREQLEARYGERVVICLEDGEPAASQEPPAASGGPVGDDDAEDDDGDDDGDRGDEGEDPETEDDADDDPGEGTGGICGPEDSGEAEDPDDDPDDASPEEEEGEEDPDGGEDTDDEDLEES